MLKISIDAVDRLLLEALQNDGRITNKSLADSAGLSQSGCIKRVQSLENSGVIAGYHATLSPQHLGLDLQVFLRVTLIRHDRSDLINFTEAVNSWPQVVACYAVTGDCDFLLHVITPDLASYRTFLMDSLTVNTLVSNISSSIVLGIEKLSHKLPID